MLLVFTISILSCSSDDNDSKPIEFRLSADSKMMYDADYTTWSLTTINISSILFEEYEDQYSYRIYYTESNDKNEELNAGTFIGRIRDERGNIIECVDKRKSLEYPTFTLKPGESKEVVEHFFYKKSDYNKPLNGLAFIEYNKEAKGNISGLEWKFEY